MRVGKRLTVMGPLVGGSSKQSAGTLPDTLLLIMCIQITFLTTTALLWPVTSLLLTACHPSRLPVNAGYLGVNCRVSRTDVHTYLAFACCEVVSAFLKATLDAEHDT